MTGWYSLLMMVLGLVILLAVLHLAVRAFQRTGRDRRFPPSEKEETVPLKTDALDVPGSDPQAEVLPLPPASLPEPDPIEVLPEIEDRPAPPVQKVVDLSKYRSRWEGDLKCAVCGRRLAKVNWLEDTPSLMSLDGRILDWDDFPPELMPRLLETHLPVCHRCSASRKSDPERPRWIH